ncbi:hypothetical protein A3K29_05390 [Candidatus Collierbacteria bacterium RIFOXYB2_FULL_46_14]|uniref:Uncharacterized protein n=1 Tax=Candidatus Collierbacteria bacterium GW2011_GWA2_46_26 TaxID=1618381 RepID=A0A0G1RTU4_9BACT|nr:MAG: hypothetical protein UX47_C0004G0038 [Candidatus Collierbacteria bacterium GW2011_GWA2_46_26]OGD73527.1 MAG: hypothetical protein A3K29_05390 [Candidatus Collierbacteria bacterium RIFOXYB2_FULL_46_14]OGD76569.1 MAG: hypothetical protein A3K43_05390 [Candidatus Collierbacteria bacterium RIFOXYA2_FULL_46_20]OGD77905.1 MAG: hypothetical protein A3K39_05390 [Candidatus Collierbacteria bacterium RIFOXYC2_FULL_43_15]OGD81195.1 MAG: hypothetical protein A2320_05885 [Pseudomonadales bacterium G
MIKQLDDRYSLERAKLSSGELSLSTKTGLAGEMEAFIGIASSFCKVPLEVVHVKRGVQGSLPVSRIGKTNIRYVGQAPAILVEPDANGNLKMIFTGEAVIEVIYNSEKVGAHGRNRGAHGQKKIYVVE